MDERKSWLRATWRIGLVLLLILGLALFLRAYFVYGEFAPAGYWSGGGDYSGGSDPFYWERALLYSFQTGKEISWDAAMNYPIGFPDVRPPLFDWFNLLAGYIATPAFAGNAWYAMVWMLNMNSAIFGVLTLIPTYLIGKEAFNRRAGILAALLLAISAAALSRSIATIGVHDSWTLFFVVCAFYFYLRALKTLNRRRWVENWFQRKSVLTGIRAFFQENRKSVLYSLMAGLSVGVIALSWQGWAYVPVILILTFVVEILMDRIRNQDAMGVTILFTFIQVIPLLLSFPWYSVRNLIHVWWDVPFYLCLVAAVLGIVFTVTRDYPWTIVIPATFVAGGVGLLVGFSVNPALLVAFYSGAGYFVKNKVYETIAEAQAPGMSQLVLNFGWFTFYIALGAIAYLIWQMPRRNNPAFSMLIMWTAGALFMAISAARFMFNAAPVMAIATGYALDLVLTRLGFDEMRRTYHSLSEGSWRNAVRKSVKPRHIIVALLVAGLVLLPNVWFAVDSAIPYEQKATYDKQIESLLPSFLQAPGYASGVSSSGYFYLGAFGYSLPKSTDYFPAAYQWLSTQDTGVALDQRPAVLAWWDYGFEIAERGGHPVVADPFQNGYSIAGQFILAQNESAAIALLILRLVQGDWHATNPHLSPALSQVLLRYGIDPNVISYAFGNPTALAPIILSNPNRYGLWDSSLQSVNTPFIYLQPILLAKLSEDQLVNLYQDVSQVTGTHIGYFMVDTRLFPMSATNTGIFYAPAELSDHRVLSLANGQVLPLDFFQIFANTSNAVNIPIQYVTATETVTNETIQYQPMFYNSMFYRAFVGYPPSQVGSSDKGIPGIDSALSQYMPDPAWNLTHFRVVYQTAYYNPYTDYSNHTNAWQAMNYEQAVAMQKNISAGRAKGVVDDSTLTDIENGAVILEYYPGALVNGTVTVGGVPLPNVHITVTDELGTPHMLTTTDASGHYSAIVPFGNITLTASVGALDGQTLIGTTTVATATFPVSVAQAMRSDLDLNNEGRPNWLMTKDLTVTPQSLEGTLYFDLNHNNAFDAADLAAGGATLQLSSTTVQETENVTAGPAGSFSLSNLVSGAYDANVTYQGHTVALSSLQVSGSATTHQDLAIPYATVKGVTLNESGAPVAGATVTLADMLNGTTWQTTSNATGGFAFRPVLPGNDSLTAALGTSSSTILTFSAGTTGLTQNLTLTPSGRVTGTTELFDVPLPYATLQFQSTSANFIVASVTSDAQGDYTLSLPAGDWNVNGRMYQGTTLYATIGSVTVRQGVATSYNPNFEDGARVSGPVSAEGATGDLRAHIGFLGANGEWWLRSALGNTYLAYLPLGTYSIVANTAGDAYFGTMTLAGTTTQALALVNATTRSGTVYWDMNRNGALDHTEGIVGARIALTDNLGCPDVTYTNATGGFTISLFNNRTYSGWITADGFAPLQINSTTAAGIGSSVSLNLTPYPVDLTGTVFLNGTPILNRALSLQAIALGGGAQSVTESTYTDGSFSLALVPGSYRLVVDENVSKTSGTWQYQNLRTDVLALPVGEGQASYNLTIVARVLVKGNVTWSGKTVTALVQFQGPDAETISATDGNFSLYLQAGSYVVRANRTESGVEQAVVQNATLPATGNLSLALGPTTQVTGRIAFDGSTITTPFNLTFARKEGGTFQSTSAANGTFATALVPGDYTVTLDNTSSAQVGGVLRYFRYSFQGNLTVPSSATVLVYDVNTTRAYDNTTVAGLVSIGGGGVDASLSFIAESADAISAQATSALDGSYSVALAPGTYVVYATRSVGSNGFLGTLTVPHATSMTYPIALDIAFLLSGATTGPDGQRVSANLSLVGAAQLNVSTDASGAYQVLLPEGSYAVTADRSQVEQGVSVTYQGTANLSLVVDTVVNLELGRIDQRSVSLTWEASQNRTISAGGSVTYTINVQNMGNVQDTFSLSGSEPGWSFSFSPSTVTLNYGTAPNSAPVTVLIQSPTNALVNHGTLTITATSTTDSAAKGSVAVTVGIAPTYGLTVQVDPLSGTFDGRYLNYTVNVQNTGNTPEDVDVSIQNPSDIATSGWSPALAQSGATTPSGLTVTNLNVAAASTASLQLVLRLNGAQGGATVVLQAATVGAAPVASQTVYTTSLPQLSPTTGIGVTGTNVALTLPPNNLLIAAIVGAVAAIAVGLFLTRRRR